MRHLWNFMNYDIFLFQVHKSETCKRSLDSNTDRTYPPNKNHITLHASQAYRN